MSKFGAYREGMAPFAYSDDVWELIGQVVPLAARERWLPDLRVGPMVDPNEGWTAHDLMINEWDEVVRLAGDENAQADDIFQMVLDKVSKGYKRLCVFPCAAKMKDGADIAFDGAFTGPGSSLNKRLGEWASEYIELSPAYCDGLKPLQVYASQGGWSYGMTLGPGHETIDFELKDGLGYWRWSKDPRLSFPTLKAAMQSAEEHAMEAI